VWLIPHFPLCTSNLASSSKFHFSPNHSPIIVDFQLFNVNIQFQFLIQVIQIIELSEELLLILVSYSLPLIGDSILVSNSPIPNGHSKLSLKSH